MRDDYGFLILDADGDIRFAEGLAASEPVNQALVRLWRQRPHDKLLSFDVDACHSLTALVVGSADATAFVLFALDANDPVFEFLSTVDFAVDIIRLLLTSPYEAMAVVDRKGVLRYLSPLHEKSLGLRRGEGVGRPVEQVITNSRLHEVARSGKADIGAIHSFAGKTQLVTRIPVSDTKGRLVGAVGNIMFKGPAQLEAMTDEVSRLRNEVTSYRKELSTLRTQRTALDLIVGRSQAITQLKTQIARVAPLNVPVLLIGESGTGKELASHAIHQLSQRAGESMVMINAASMPASLVESELFGYEAGAFTGAERKGRRGKFEQANNGTMFLDEIGDMPLEIQVKVLRVLQDGTFERVGSDKPRHSDFRLISATNRDFESLIKAGEFRLDLFYRLSGVTLQLPPLRERLDDIELLAEQALIDFAARHSTKVKHLGPGVLDFLCGQRWPGNVRQLIHTVQSAAIFADMDWLTVDDFLVKGVGSSQDSAPVDGALSLLATAPPLPAQAAAQAPLKATGASVRQAVQLVEEGLIRDAMERHRGNKQRVALELGVSRSYLYKRLTESGLDWTRRPPPK